MSSRGTQRSLTMVLALSLMLIASLAVSVVYGEAPSKGMVVEGYVDLNDYAVEAVLNKPSVRVDRDN